MLVDFEKDVLRYVAGFSVSGLTAGAAMNQAREVLKSSGYMHQTGELSVKGVATLLDDRSILLLRLCSGPRGANFVMADKPAREGLRVFGLAKPCPNGAWTLTDLGHDVREYIASAEVAPRNPATPSTTLTAANASAHPVIPKGNAGEPTIESQHNPLQTEPQP